MRTLGYRSSEGEKYESKRQIMTVWRELMLFCKIITGHSRENYFGWNDFFFHSSYVVTIYGPSGTHEIFMKEVRGGMQFFNHSIFSSVKRFPRSSNSFSDKNDWRILMTSSLLLTNMSTFLVGKSRWPVIFFRARFLVRKVADFTLFVTRIEIKANWISCYLMSCQVGSI